MQRCRELEIELVDNTATYEASGMPEKSYDLAAIVDLDEPYPGLEREEIQDAYPDLLDDAQEDSFPTTVPLDFYGKSPLRFHLVNVGPLSALSTFRIYSNIVSALSHIKQQNTLDCFDKLCDYIYGSFTGKELGREPFLYLDNSHNCILSVRDVEDE